jgi:hypothetical protein
MDVEKLLDEELGRWENLASQASNYVESQEIASAQADALSQADGVKDEAEADEIKLAALIEARRAFEKGD